jgi:hypothetical protein
MSPPSNTMKHVIKFAHMAIHKAHHHHHTLHTIIEIAHLVHGWMH